MQSAFSLTLLTVSTLYTWIGYSALDFMNAGMPGPGYFPVLIGIALVILTLWNFTKDVKQRHNQTSPNHSQTPDKDRAYPKDVVWLILLFAAYIYSMPKLGMLLSTATFMFLTLQVINRGAWLKNSVYAVLMSAGVYVLFEVFLKTGLPTGTIWA